MTRQACHLIARFASHSAGEDIVDEDRAVQARLPEDAAYLRTTGETRLRTSNAEMA